VALSRNGKWLIGGSDASLDGVARLWDLATRKEIREFKGHDGRGAIYSVALSADDKWLVTGGDDFTARLWEVATGKAVQTFRDVSADNVAISPDGKWVATTGRTESGVRPWEVARGNIRLWDVATGKNPLRFDGAGPLCFSPDGRWLVTGGIRPTLIDVT